MAKHGEMDEKMFAEWVATRPDCIKELIAKLPPDRLYLLKSSNHRVTIYSYNEDGTVSVSVSGDYNRVIFERNVFGVKPEDLEECDLPSDDEPVGAILTDDNDIDRMVDIMRKEKETGRE